MTNIIIRCDETVLVIIHFVLKSRYFYLLFGSHLAIPI